jgi:hypothetical protein
MQRAGVRWIFADRPDLWSAEPFNTNPVLSGYALGLLESTRKGDPAPAVPTLLAAVGGIGDRLVWGLLRPLAIVLSLLAASAGPIPAAVALLLVYNPPELALRWRSVRRGRRGIDEILKDLAPNCLPRLARWLARIAAVAVGALGGFWALDLVLAGRIYEVCALIVTAGVVWFVGRRVVFSTWRNAWLALLVAATLWLVNRLL